MGSIKEKKKKGEVRAEELRYDFKSARQTKSRLFTRLDCIFKSRREGEVGM